MSVRESFVERFGEEQAVALENAGNGHRADLLAGDEHGPDAFRDAIVIAIGFECFTSDHYRKSHGITVPVADLTAWIREHGDLAHHTGPIDYLAMLVGRYQPYIPEYDEPPAEVAP